MIPDERKLKAESGFGGDDSSDDSSVDDEGGELLTEELEEGFFKVLSRLKKKDPKLYDENIRFFPAQCPEGDSEPKNKEGQKSKKEYKEWLKGQKDKVKDKDVKKDLEALHDFWTNPKLNKGEQFLRDYILNKKFLDQDDDFNVEKEIEKLEEEEKEIEDQTSFEQSYNNRFENPDEEFLKKYPKIMENSEEEINNSGNSEMSNKSESVINNESETMEKLRKTKEKLKDDIGVIEQQVDKGTNRTTNKKVHKVQQGSKKIIILDVTEENCISRKRKHKLEEGLNEEPSPKKKEIAGKEVNGESYQVSNDKNKLRADKKSSHSVVGKVDEPLRPVQVKKRNRHRKKHSSIVKPEQAEKINKSIDPINLSNHNSTEKAQASPGALQQKTKRPKRRKRALRRSKKLGEEIAKRQLEQKEKTNEGRIRERNIKRDKKFKKIKEEFKKKQMHPPGALEKNEGNKMKKLKKLRHRVLLKIADVLRKKSEMVRLIAENRLPKNQQKLSNIKANLVKKRNRGKRNKKST